MLCALLLCVSGTSLADEANEPVPLIYCTDVGNDVDDILALGMIHALQSRGECELLAVTVTKDHALAGPFIDAVNTFYGRPDIPIGVCNSGVTPGEDRFIGLAQQRDDGKLRYPHDLATGKDAPPAVAVLRKSLAAADDGTVVIVQVGFSTNLAALLASEPDEHSDLNGVELIKRKARLLSIMAGAFTKAADGTGPRNTHREYNVVKDLPAAKVLAERWPTPIVWSGYELGLSMRFPHQSIERDYRYVAHHPLAEAYVLFNPPPHDRPTWDLTSVLYAVRPGHDYFGLSESGRVSIDDRGRTVFESAEEGRDRVLLVSETRRGAALEAMQLLASQPPG
jgi:inosine-uridine nucleoside N-ribohydrolase